MRFLVYVRFILLTICLVLPATARAHPIPYGTAATELSADGTVIHLTTDISRNIFVYGQPDSENKLFFQNYFQRNFIVSYRGAPCSFKVETWKLARDMSHTSVAGTFTCNHAVTTVQDLKIHSELCVDIFQNFDHYITLSFPSGHYEINLNASAKDFPGVPMRSLGGIVDYFLIVAFRFIWMGILHIWGGYDHVLFLLSVVLLARSIKQILLLVTSFTLAHSITLILAGLNILTLSPKIVEPTIAVTIVFMALRNLYSLRNSHEARPASNERVALTFGFGLIHGLGFASALANTTIPQKFFVPALLSFNIGIEMGQLAILAVALPALWYIDQTSYRLRILTYFSYSVCAMACFWILVRVFL